MATATRIPMEVYLDSVYEPDADFVDGEVEERPMGVYDHAAWQQAIQRWFLNHEEEWNVVVLPELRIQTGATHFRVADVALLDADAPAEQIPTYPPVAVFEVLSPEDRIQRMSRKLGDYHAMGIAGIFVVDPETGMWSRYEDGQLVRREEFRLPERGIHFALAEIGKLVRRPGRR